MKNIKNIIFQLPEYYILIVVLLTDFTPPFNFNLISVGLGVMVFLHIIFRNRMTGMFIATLFLLINLYLPFALMWEFRDFTSVNSESMKFLLSGFSLILFNLFVSALMIYKYIKQEEEEEVVAEEEDGTVLVVGKKEEIREVLETGDITNRFQNSNIPNHTGQSANAI